VVQLELDYLWAARGRKKLYWFYRRNGRRIPIKSPEGKRLAHGDDGFLEAYERIHATFGRTPSEDPTVGTLAHLIVEYKASPEYTQNIAKKTQKDYGRYLDLLKKKHGHRSIALMPREAVLKMRDEYKATPRKANYLLAVLGVILTYAGDRKQTFRLPPHWQSPAAKPKKLKTGEGYRPWEESEIGAYRKRWKLGTLERALFEAFLNSGQRGGDIAPMVRQQYAKGEIAVAQEKTGERVWIPVSQDLRSALAPWLKSHKHVVLFATPKGRPLKVDHMRHLMRDAIRAAKLPDDCTLHGLRYTFATRAIELGLDWQTIESIVGHKTAQMASKYTEKRRRARFAIASLDEARKQARNAKVKTATDRSENRPRLRDDK
jgi:integrase